MPEHTTMHGPSQPSAAAPRRVTRSHRVVLHLASTGRRLLAGAIDLVPVALMTAWLWRLGVSGADQLVPVKWAFLPEHIADLYRLSPTTLLRPLLVPLACAVLWLGLWLAATNTTPGTRALGLAIVDRDGERLDPLRQMLRLAGMVGCMLTLGLGWGLSLVLPSRRGMHDLLAGSFVVLAAKSGMRAL